MYTSGSMTTQGMYNKLKMLYGISGTQTRADLLNAIKLNPNKLIMNMNDWFPTLP